MEILSEADVRFKGVEHYNSLKSIFNRDDISVLYEKELKYGSNIGYVSNLMKRLNPSSYKDAYDLYIESGRNEKNMPPTKRGRDENELEALAKRWMDFYGKGDIPLSDFYDALVLHAIIETYDGFRFEKEAKDKLSEAGYETSWATASEDGKYGVDIVARNELSTILIQIKPVSFFLSRRMHTKSDRAKMWIHMNAAKNDFGESLIYKFLIYDGKTGMWVFNEKSGRCAFDYDELVDIGGNYIGPASITSNETEKLFKK